MDVPVPEALEGPKVRLTKTERQIISVFFKRGGTAKEIAEVLGVAPRTVYKATYKYRLNLKALGIDLNDLKRGEDGKPVQAKPPALKARGLKNVLTREVLLEEIKKVVRETLTDIMGIQSTPRSIQPQINVDGIIKQLDRLESSIEKLAESIDRLAAAFSGLNVKVVTSKEESQGSGDNSSGQYMPSFVRGNPWLAVLKSRGHRV